MKTNQRRHGFLVTLGLLVGCTVFLFSAQAWAAPAAPGYLYAKGVNSTQIGVNWQSVAGVQGYNVYRSDSESGDYQKIAQVTGADATYYVDWDADYATDGVQPISASTKYYYKVSAYDETGESPLTGVTSFSYTGADGQAVQEVISAGETTQAGPVGGLSLTDNHDGTIKIKWDTAKEPNISGYNIYRSSSSGSAPVKLNDTLVTSTEYTDNVSMFQDYYYSVTAVDDKAQEGIKTPQAWIKPQPEVAGVIPHVKYQQDTKECAYCHDSHSASGQDLLTKVSESDVCYVCHDGTGSQNAVSQEFNGNYPSKHPLNENGQTCSSCHDAHLDYTAVDQNGSQTFAGLLKPVSKNGFNLYKGNQQCYKCHGINSTLVGGDYQTSFENSAHNTKLPDPASGTQIKCSQCHQPHAGPESALQVYKDENACLNCHNGGRGSTAGPNIYSHLYTGSDSETRHDVLSADQQQSGAKLQCTNCHNPHGVTADNKITDPDSPSPANLWTGSKNDFCLKCHDGDLPTDTQTAPYTAGVDAGTKTLTNIGASYSTSFHAQLDCTVCHDSHGSINSYSLKTATTSTSGTAKTGLLVYTWKYQDNGQTVQGVDARFFCNTCHGPNNTHIESKSFPTDCFTCHKHGSNF